MKHYAYDLECFESLFTGIFINVDKKYDKVLEEYEECDIKGDKAGMQDALTKLDYRCFIITHDKSIDDSIALVQFLNTKDLWLTGFNSHAYDDLLLSAIKMYVGTNKLTTVELRRISDMIIDNQGSYNAAMLNDELKSLMWNRKTYVSIDVKKVNYLKNVSLKFTAILLKHYKIQDLPYINLKIKDYTEDLLQEILRYNINDVLITRKLLKFSKNELRIRIDTINLYNVNVISDSRSSMANKLISHYYHKISGVKPNNNQQTIRYRINFSELIESNINFKTKEFNALLDTLNSTNFHVGVDTFDPSITYQGVKYQLGVGGLHSVDRGISIVTDDTFDLIDVDANSFYPTSILNHKVHPQHIPDYYYLPMLKTILESRLDAKFKAKNVDGKYNDVEQAGFKSTADILKIVVNIIYGKLGDAYHWLLDKAAMYKVTLNCQLALLMLIEALHINNFKVISANTDGIVAKVPKKRRDEYFALCEEWVKNLKYGVEYTEYKEYYATSVNHYLAVKTDGKVKEKGFFVRDKSKLHDFLTKGYSMPIVAIAAYNYYIYKTPVEDTLRNHRDIHDFCIAIKIGSGYSPYKVEAIDNKIVRTKLQHTIRYFVSIKGDTIVKFNGVKTIHLMKGKRLTLFNDYFIPKDNDFNNFNIDYGFYLKEVYKLIDTVNGKILSTSKGKAASGKLFDL